MSKKEDAIIVGAGMAGLTCALELQRAGLAVTVLEARDRPGGRLRTEQAGDFRLDAGFQVLLTAYPEVRRYENVSKLAAGRFLPGARVHKNGRTFEVMDPLRRPASAFRTLAAPIGGLADKARIAKLALEIRRMSLETVASIEDIPTADYLRIKKQGPRMVDDFIRPFMSGIFLETELTTSARVFAFVFKMFAEGAAALPEGGMESIPRELAANLGAGTVRCGEEVEVVENTRVTLKSGEKVEANAVVLAVDGDTAAKLTRGRISPPRAWNGTTCLYFSAPRSPLGGRPILWLNANRSSLVNHVAVPSDVVGGYAPPGSALISVNLIGTRRGKNLADMVQKELESSFGREVATWKHLQTFALPRALPRQNPGDCEGIAEGFARLSPTLVICGDHVAGSSLNAAMASGRKAAEEVHKNLGLASGWK